jgi:hypothetical protein
MWNDKDPSLLGEEIRDHVTYMYKHYDHDGTPE